MYQPRFSSPIRESAGMRTSSQKVSLVRPSPMTHSGRTVMPGVLSGSTKVEMPRCLGASGSVRAASQTCVARCADEV